MNINTLVKMANNIGAFFNSEPVLEDKIKGVETHLRNAWEPRMRQSIIAHVDNGGAELMDIVVEAVKRLK
jgi:formate dehydrogenase subunit delta